MADGVDMARFPRVTNLGLRDPLRIPEAPILRRSGAQSSMSQLERNLPNFTQALRTSFAMDPAERTGTASDLPVVGPAVDLARSGVLTQPITPVTPGIEASAREVQRTGIIPPGTQPVGAGTEPLVRVNPAEVAQTGGRIASQIAGTDQPQGLRARTAGAADIAGLAQAEADLLRGGEATTTRPGGIREIRTEDGRRIFTNLQGTGAEVLNAARSDLRDIDGAALTGGVQFTSPEGITTTAADAARTGTLSGLRRRPIQATQPISEIGEPVSPAIDSALERASLRRRIAEGEAGAAGEGGVPELGELLSPGFNLAGLQTAAKIRTGAQAEQQRGIRNRLDERRVGAQERQAETAERRLGLDITKQFMNDAGEVVKTELIAPGIDTNALPYEDPETGRLIQPQTEAKLRIGDQILNIPETSYPQLVNLRDQLLSRRIADEGGGAPTERLISEATQDAYRILFGAGQG